MTNPTSVSGASVDIARQIDALCGVFEKLARAVDASPGSRESAALYDLCMEKKSAILSAFRSLECDCTAYEDALRGMTDKKIAVQDELIAAREAFVAQSTRLANAESGLQNARREGAKHALRVYTTLDGGPLAEVLLLMYPLTDVEREMSLMPPRPAVSPADQPMREEVKALLGKLSGASDHKAAVVAVVDELSEAYAKQIEHTNVVRSELLARIAEAEAPWPPRDVVTKLVAATKHLLHDHNCDQHGYEEVGACVEVAERFLARSSGEAPPTPDEHRDPLQLPPGYELAIVPRKIGAQLTRQSAVASVEVDANTAFTAWRTRQTEPGT